MHLPFARSAQSTLGVEWELALVDALLARDSLSANAYYARARLLDVASYDVALDLTTGETTFGSTTVIRFACSQPGTSTFADLVGATVGAVGAWLMARADARHSVRREYQALYGVGLVLSSYAGAVALGNLYFFTAAVFGMGVLMSLDPVVAQAVGDDFSISRAHQYLAEIHWDARIAPGVSIVHGNGIVLSHATRSATSPSSSRCSATCSWRRSCAR